MEYIPSFIDQMDANYLMHHGIKGMKWGIRRYQDDSGKLTPAGQKRYAKRISRLEKKIDKRLDKIADAQADSIVLKKRVADDISNRPKYYSKPRHVKRAYKNYNKRAMRDAKTIEHGKQKTARLLQKASKMGLTAKAEPTIRKGHAYFVDRAMYANGYYYEQGTHYDVPLNSMKIRLT